MTYEAAPKPPGSRLKSLAAAGAVSVRKKPTGEIKQLSPQHLKMIALMVYGSDDPAVSQIEREIETTLEGERVKITRPIRPGEPLTLREAAIMARVRLRQAREIFGHAPFQRTLAAEMQRMRESEKPRSLATLVEVRDDPGLGKAADRKVRMQAAQAILGEGESRSGGPHVTVNVGQTLVAGIVVAIAPDMVPETHKGPAIEHGE